MIAYACTNISQQIGMPGIRNVRRMKSALIPQNLVKRSYCKKNFYWFSSFSAYHVLSTTEESDKRENLNIQERRLIEWIFDVKHIFGF